ncbi:MAG: PEGA domain-containing protein [Planctomycetota bacterium]
MRRAVTGLLSAALAAVALTCAGCFAQRIVIETEPVGAHVVVNERSMGNGPVAIQTADFGDLDLRVAAPGYTPTWERLPNPRPWWGYDPMLLLMEICPYPFTQDRVFKVKLTPQQPIDAELLDQHARAAHAAESDGKTDASTKSP